MSRHWTPECIGAARSLARSDGALREELADRLLLAADAIEQLLRQRNQARIIAGNAEAKVRRLEAVLQSEEWERGCEERAKRRGPAMSDEPTYDEIEIVREGICDGCKGVTWIHETGCYKDCEAFAEDLAELREESGKNAIL